MVALLTALISVIVTSIPQIYNLLHTQKSFTVLSLFPSYGIPGESIFLVFNSGDRPAAIAGVMFNASPPVGSWGGSLLDEADSRMIDPGKGKLVRVTFPGLRNKSYNKFDFIGKNCEMAVVVTQFSGEKKNIVFQMTTVDHSILLSGNRDISLEATHRADVIAKQKLAEKLPSGLWTAIT